MKLEWPVKLFKLTYEVVITFVGFRLILFRVRASGTGMLVGKRRGVKKEEEKKLRGLRPEESYHKVRTRLSTNLGHISRLWNN